MPYAPLQFGQAYRPSISYLLAGRLHEASWMFRMASDPFQVQPIDVVVAKPEEALVFRIRKNVGSVAAGIESSGHPISDSALVPERDGFDYAIKIPLLCETGCSYKLKFTGELNAKPLWRRVEVPRQPGKFPPKLLSAVETMNQNPNGRYKALAYAQHLGTWVWTSVSGSNKKSVEDSALAGCRQMASKEGLAEPCLIY